MRVEVISVSRARKHDFVKVLKIRACVRCQKSRIDSVTELISIPHVSFYRNNDGKNEGEI